MSQFRQLPYILRDQMPAELHPMMIRAAEFDIIETLAGPVAEMRQTCGRVGLMVLQEPMIRDILAVDPRSGSTDIHRVRLSLDWLAPVEPEKTLNNLWRHAVLLTEVEFFGILAMARLLCAAGEIDGEVFEAEWRRVRPTEATRKRRGLLFAASRLPAERHGEGHLSS